MLLPTGPDQAVGLSLGRSRRGESCKTGREQGVVSDYPGTWRILRQRAAGKSSKDKLFGISSDVYRRWWFEAADHAAGGRIPVGPPHSARHHGPKPFEMSASKAANKIMSAINKEKRFYAFPFLLAAGIFMCNLMPIILSDWFMKSFRVNIEKDPRYFEG